MKGPLFLLLFIISSGTGATPAPDDPTAMALTHCLAAPSAQSTADQTECEAAAARSYDRRMNSAYGTLTRRLEPAAVARLRAAQRQWLSFRSTDEEARSALFASRQGTMYVPMEAAARTAVVRDRALQLEAMVRILQIED